MKKFLQDIMQYKFIYRIMPKWIKFMYCFDVMLKNKSGSLHLGNGYSLNFETMKIESDTDTFDDYWIVFKNGEYLSGVDESGNPLHAKDYRDAFKFYNFDDAVEYFKLGYCIIRE